MSYYIYFICFSFVIIYWYFEVQYPCTWVLGYYTPNEIFQYELRKNRDYANYDMELETGEKSPKNLFSFIMPFPDKNRISD